VLGREITDLDSNTRIDVEAAAFIKAENDLLARKYMGGKK